MAQPTPYSPDYDFSDFQASNPSDPLPGDRIDVEFAAIEATTDDIRTNLALIQRDDGLLANLSVHPEALAAATRALIVAGGTPRGDWATATSYAVGDIVENVSVYICLTAHTSGTFATDLAAEKWMLLSYANTLSETAYFERFSGTGSPQNITLSQEFGTDEKEVEVYVDGLRIDPNNYTLSGTTLSGTFLGGTNNVLVFAPDAAASAAVIAAQAAQAAAETAEANAETAEANAETAEANAAAAAEAARDEVVDIIPAGGTTGQVLAKASGADHDLEWANGALPDIAGQTDQASPAVDDVVLIQQSSDGSYRKVELQNLPGGGTGAVDSVFGRTGAVAAQSGDYDADEISETASNKIMTAAERTKLSGIEASANNYSHPNHTGDVTSTGDGATVIADEAVTNAKMAHMAQSTIKGRAAAAGTGDATDLSATQVRTILNVADGAEANPAAASQAQAGDGTNTTEYSWTPQRVHQAAKDAVPFSLIVAVGDETTALTTGTGKVTFRLPHAVTLTDVRASLTTASSSGAVTVDINEGGATILSTKLTIDQDEKTSTMAATAAVISDSALADDAEMTIDIDGAGTGAAGLKVTLIGYKTTT